MGLRIYAFLSTQKRGNRENAPKSPNLGKMASSAVISPLFTRFREKGQKGPKWAPAARLAQSIIIPMLFEVFLRPPAPKTRFGGEKCDFHQIPPIFMKMGGIHQKSAISPLFTTWGVKVKKIPAYLIWLPFKA